MTFTAFPVGAHNLNFTSCSFRKSVNATPPSDFSSQIVESLRNYVANQEIVIRESRLNTNNYYYDTKFIEQ